jgi:hypothetical protein
LNSEEEFIVPSIYTSNIEAKLKLIEEYGGKVLKGKTPIGKNAEYGYFALFEDPDGNKICFVLHGIIVHYMKRPIETVLTCSSGSSLLSGKEKQPMKRLNFVFPSA